MKKNLNKVYLFLVIVSSFLPLLTYTKLHNIIYVGSIKGFFLILASSFLIFYSQSKNKKVLFNIGNVIGIVGYIILLYYSFWLKGKAVEENIVLEFEVGFYLVLCNLVILIINYISIYDSISSEGNIKKSNNMINNIVGQEVTHSENNTSEKPYILANYILGLQIKNMYNVLTIIVFDEENNQLSFVIGSDKDNVIKKEIKLEDINDITYKKNLVINNEPKRNDSDKEFTAQIAAAIMFGPMGSMVGTSGLLDDINNYEKVSFNSQFDIEISCKI